MNVPQDYPRSYLYRRVVGAKLFMDAHFTDRIGIGCIARKACFSSFHFIRLFKSIYNTTPHQYLVALRIEHAKLLLTNGGLVTAVCEEVGFESLPSFSMLFKKATGVTPAAFRQQQLAARREIAAAPLQAVPHCFATAAGWL